MRRITCLLLILLVMSGTVSLFAQVPEMINYQGRVAVNGTNYNGAGNFKFSLIDSGVNSSWGATASATVSGGWVTLITVTDGGTNYVSAPNVVITDSTGSGSTAQSYISPAGVVTNIKVTAPGDGNYSSSPTVTVDEPPEVMEYTTYWANDALVGGEPTSAVGLTVTKGLFSVKLGDTTLANMAALPATVFTNGELYLRVWFDHGSGPQQLTPYQRLVSVPYALKAAGVAAGSITESMLANGAISSNKLATGAVTTDALADGAVTAADVAAGAIESNALATGSVTVEKFYSASDGPLSLVTIPNPGPEGGDEFGYCVTEVGNGLLAVGEPGDSTVSNSAGRLHLYDADGTFVRTIANPTPIAGDEFGNSVAALGSDRLIIGAIDKTLGTNYSCGAAYVYSIDGTLLVTITNPTPKVDDWFGESVASVGNDKILVGASHDDLGASGAGCAYLFDTNGTLLLTVTNPAPVGLDYYGNCVVGLDAQRFVVGAYWKDRGGPYPGEAYLYDVSGNLLVTITNPVPNSNDRFGWSLAIVDGDKILVGAPRDDTAGYDAGSVYLFDTNGTLLLSVPNPVATGSGQFGYAVASRGDDRFFVGAPYDDSAAANAGRTYVFDTSGSLIATCESPFGQVGQSYGEAVAVLSSGGYAAGCPSYDSPIFSDAGIAYIRTIGPVVPSEFAEMLADGSIPATKLDASYVRTEGDTMTGPLTIAGGGILDVGLDVAGNAIIGPLSVSDGTGDGNSLSIVHGSGKAEIEYDYWPGILRLYVESTNPLVSMEFQQNVGIGVENPGQKLDVGGNVRADSFLYSALRTNYAVVVADAFMPVSSAEGYAHGSGAYLTAAVTAEMTAPVQLPHGAVITRAQGFFYDNSAQNVAISLYALVLGTGNNVQLATMSSSGTPGYGSAADTSIVSPTVDNTRNGYYVHAEANPWDGPNLRVLGAVITYTLDETQ